MVQCNEKINPTFTQVTPYSVAVVRVPNSLVSYPTRWSFSFILGPMHWSTPREHIIIVQLSTANLLASEKASEAGRFQGKRKREREPASGIRETTRWGLKLRQSGSGLISNSSSWGLLRKLGCHKVTTVPSSLVCCSLIVVLRWRWGGWKGTGCWWYGWGILIEDNQLVISYWLFGWGWYWLASLGPLTSPCTHNICYEPDWWVLIWTQKNVLGIHTFS